MWRRKPKHKTIDAREVENLMFKLPGVDNSKIIHVEGISGVYFLGGFIPDKHQPKPIVDILLEQLLEKERNSRNQQ